jgi:hypothetical protein
VVLLRAAVVRLYFNAIYLPSTSQGAPRALLRVWRGHSTHDAVDLDGGQSAGRCQGASYTFDNASIVLDEPDSKAPQSGNFIIVHS